MKRRHWLQGAAAAGPGRCPLARARKPSRPAAFDTLDLDWTDPCAAARCRCACTCRRPCTGRAQCR
jgi:hypothetical protein